jgi:hypothetical protein
MDDQSYTGWIPTVGGKLSFSIVGDVNHPTKAYNFNETVAGIRYIFSYQERDLSDATKFLWLGDIYNYLKGRSGKFYFVFQGCVDDSTSDINSPLSGQVYALYSADMNYVKDSLSSCLKRLKEKHRTQPSSIRNVFNLDLFSNLSELYKSDGLHMLDVQIDRSGIAQMSTPSDYYQKLLFNSKSDMFSQDGVSADHVASELFFFLKDLCHIHQHHSPRTDTIVDLYNTTNNKNAWINETLRVLYRRVLDHKRSPKPNTNSSARGVLSYIKSFQKLFCSDKTDQIIILNNEELELSLVTCSERTKEKIESSHRSTTSILTIIFGVFAIIASITSAISLTDHTKIAWTEPSPIAISIINTLISNPVFLAAAMLSAFLWSYIKRASYRYDSFVYFQLFELQRLLFSALPKIQLLIIFGTLTSLLIGVPLYWITH